MLTLVMGEDRELTVDLSDAAGAPLLVTGWALELRLGSAQRARLTKVLTPVGGVPGRATCVFSPTDLPTVGAGPTYLSIWRVDAGLVTMVADTTVTIREVL